MPGWSPEIANEFIGRALKDGRDLTQVQLQYLVYIAHGWRLAMSGEPLTGDRPEAFAHGAVYHRLEECLARSGIDPVRELICSGPDGTLKGGSGPARADLCPDEVEVIETVYKSYSQHSLAQLAVPAAGDDGPWRAVYAEGRGERREISHSTIREQFLAFAKRIAAAPQP